MTKSILSQLSIIMTSSYDIVSPPRIRGGIQQVSGGTTAGPRRIRGGIRVSRGGIESGQVRGSVGGLEKLSAEVSGLVKKNLDCTVDAFNVYLQRCFNISQGKKIIIDAFRVYLYGASISHRERRSLLRLGCIRMVLQYLTG